MASKRISYWLVKQHRTYTVDDVARLLGVHKNTVRSWLKSGLPRIDDRKPLLIAGADLKAWLKAKRKSAKQPCGPGRFYCFRCKAPKHPALGMVDYFPRTEKSGCLKAICETCQASMNRNASIRNLAAVMPNIDVQIVRLQSSIRWRAQHPSNCDLSREA